MDPELKQELDQIHALEKDNHDMLSAIRRDHWLGVFGKIIVWLGILVLSLYLYQQYLQPLISKFITTGGMSASGPFSLPSFAELQKLISSFQGK